MDFKICKEVSALGIKVAFLVIHNLKNNYDDSLKSKIEDFYTNFIQSYTSGDLDQDPNITGYRKLHEKITISDESLIASPESLIKILFKYKSLRPINFIVDIYNYVAIKNRVSIGAHDINYIIGNVRLCFTKGGELFIPLGKKMPQKVNPGEYCYIDDEDEILCRLDCRQCNKTKISANTDSCLFIIQGHENINISKLNETAMELKSLFTTHDTTSHEIFLK